MSGASSACSIAISCSAWSTWNVARPRGDIQKLLAQFARPAGGASASSGVLHGSALSSTLRPARREKLAVLRPGAIEEFLIATTMAIAGLFAVLAWNAVLPDRRDCLVLGPAAGAAAHHFLAKVAALATALGVSAAR